MKSFSIAALGAAAVLTLAGMGFATSAHAGDVEWTYPSIAKFGPVHPLTDASVMPKKNGVYKAIFDVTSAAKAPDQLEPGLSHVARAVNVFAYAGVPLKNLKFVAVLHGPSTDAILSNEAYKKRYNVDNPNIPLIEALIKAGVHVDVCGQALAEHNIDHADVLKGVRIDLSALATVIVYGDMGYAYMKQ